MDEDYDGELESSIADVLQCTPDSKGDHILAARFLSRFVPAEVPWIHLDLASSNRSGGLAHVPTDFTGFGVRYSLGLLLDQELLGSVVGNVIANSIRYARSALLIGAREENGELLLFINDDGAGYPPAMIEQQGDYVLGLNQSSGSTGLGLYFAARIAALHERDGRRGRIELGNGGPLGGGEFRIYLP